jgi:hypothetical protein
MSAGAEPLCGGVRSSRRRVGVLVLIVVIASVTTFSLVRRGTPGALMWGLLLPLAAAKDLAGQDGPVADRALVWLALLGVGASALLGS